MHEGEFEYDPTVVLAGEITLSDKQTVRLPLDVCRRIALFSKSISWIKCDRCHSELLNIWSRRPFVANLPSRWMCTDDTWLCTDRGNVMTTTQRPHTTDLVLLGRQGVACPNRTPATVAVRLETGRTIHFENQLVELRQRQWYKVVDGQNMCRSCFANLRFRRTYFRRWLR